MTLFNGDWFIEKRRHPYGKRLGTTLSDIYMPKCEKEALHKGPLKLNPYYRYFVDVFITWPLSVAAVSELLDIFNMHEPPIIFSRYDPIRGSN